MRFDYKKHNEGLILKILSSDSKAQAAYEYCLEHGITHNWNKAQDMILTDDDYAFLYSKHVLKRSWKRHTDSIRERLLSATGEARLVLIISQVAQMALSAKAQNSE